MRIGAQNLLKKNKRTSTTIRDTRVVTYNFFFSSTKKKVVVWFSSPIFHTASRHFFVAENLSQRGSKSLNSLGESQKMMNSSARFPQHTYYDKYFPWTGYYTVKYVLVM